SSEISCLPVNDRPREGPVGRHAARFEAGSCLPDNGGAAASHGGSERARRPVVHSACRRMPAGGLETEAPLPKSYVRLTQPLVRDTKGGELRPATWDEALARTVDGFQAAKAAHGPTTFGTFSCSKATNEVNFAAQKFSRTVLGSNNIDSCNRT